MIVNITATPASLVTVASPYTEVTINSSGNTVQIFSTLGPQGLPGEAGSQGPPGPAGPQGVPGIPEPGYVRKVAVSGSPHPIYLELTMANGNTEATIPGSGTLNTSNIIVSIRGAIQTDFTFAGRTATMNFTPNINDRNRMVIQYEEL